MSRRTLTKQVRLGAAIGSYLDLRRRQQMAEGTLAGERSVLKRFARSVGGDPWMSQLSSEHVEKFFYGTPEEPGLSGSLAESSFNLALARLTRFMAYGYRNNWIFTDLTVNVGPLYVPDSEKIRLNPEQLVQLQEAARWPRDRAVIALAINTALRASEICALRVRYVDLDAGVLSVWVVKTRKFRYLPITADLDHELRVWLRYYAEQFPDRPLDPEWFLVPSMVHVAFIKGGGYAPRCVLRPSLKMTHPWDVVARSFAELGWEDVKGQKIHMLRRSVATIYHDDLAETEPMAIEATRELLNHTDVKVTQLYIGRTYARERMTKSLKGQAFLSSMVKPAGENVLPFARTRGVN